MGVTGVVQIMVVICGGVDRVRLSGMNVMRHRMVFGGMGWSKMIQGYVKGFQAIWEDALAYGTMQEDLGWCWDCLTLSPYNSAQYQTFILSLVYVTHTIIVFLLIL